MVKYSQQKKRGIPLVKILCFDISSLCDSEYFFLYEKSTPERKARADRYRNADDKKRCIVAGALLSYALSDQVTPPPDDFTIQKNEHGKPYIKEFSDFNFNLSHSGSYVVIGYGSSPIGIDVEEIRTDKDLKKVALRYFTKSELSYVEEKDFEDRFFEIWTGKESYLKYLGTGLSKDMNTLDVLELKKTYLRTQNIGNGYYLSFFSTDENHELIFLDFKTLTN